MLAAAAPLLLSSHGSMADPSSADGEPSRAHYDAVTPGWVHMLGGDLHVGYFRSPTDSLDLAGRRLTDLMAETARLAPGMVVLDVGCGVGSPALRLAGTFGVQVVGISNSRVGVDLSSRRAADARLSASIRFELRDAADLGYESESFDCVWMLESSHSIHDKQRLVAEVERVLRPGGFVVLCDIMLRREPTFLTAVENAESFKFLQGAFGGAELATLDRHVRWLESVDLSVASRIDISREVSPTFSHWRKRAEQHREGACRLMGSEHWQTFRDACDVLARLFAQDTLCYGLVGAQKRGRSPVR